MKHFDKVHSKFRKSQRERGEYAVMKKNQRKAERRQEHVKADNMTLLDALVWLEGDDF